MLKASLKRYFLTGLLVITPIWGTFLILKTLFLTVDSILGDLLAQMVPDHYVPGLGILTLILLVQSKILQIDFADEAAWVSFLALLIALAIPTYYRFERPAQNALRKLLLRGSRPQLSDPTNTRVLRALKP